MGLGVDVGMLAYLIGRDEEGVEWLEEKIATLNGVLAQNGLPGHEEPRALDIPPGRATMSFPYSYVAALKRAMCCVLEKQPLRTGEVTEADTNFMLDTVSVFVESHILSHSDAAGFYVPLPFDEPLCDDELPGSFAGSSYTLLAELLQLAPALGIQCNGEDLAPAEADKLADVVDDDPLHREKVVWFAFYEAARASITHKTLIVFN